ncbi:hypothetical protein MO973_00455, partial [Paenibacillus sp. TRM 82003]|nr:hypothetical protein [Paenibacillus sp. TRM 82003]
DTDIIFVNSRTGNSVSFRALCFSGNNKGIQVIHINHLSEYQMKSLAGCVEVAPLGAAIFGLVLMIIGYILR